MEGRGLENKIQNTRKGFKFGRSIARPWCPVLGSICWLSATWWGAFIWTINFMARLGRQQYVQRQDSSPAPDNPELTASWALLLGSPSWTQIIAFHLTGTLDNSLADEDREEPRAPRQLCHDNQVPLWNYPPSLQLWQLMKCPRSDAGSTQCTVLTSGHLGLLIIWREMRRIERFSVFAGVYPRVCL